MSTRLPRLTTEHPAAVESARHECTAFHRVSDWRGLSIALQRTGAKRFSLMRHWFYIMIGFASAAQIQEGNENVV